MHRALALGLAGVAGFLSCHASAAGARLDLPPARAVGAVVFHVPDFRGLRLFLDDKEGNRFGSLDAVNSAVRRAGHRMVFAMNAGMYETDRSPTGLFIQDGKKVAELNLQQRAQDGRTPNFYLHPNGVFAVDRFGPAIFSTQEFATSAPKEISLATQSGPLLLAKGRIVARAVATGTDAPVHRKRRNGICVNGKSVVFAKVDAMTLHEFAVYLRDVVGCVDALYLDGSVSSVYDAQTGRHDPVDAQNPLGPIIAYIE